MKRLGSNFMSDETALQLATSLTLEEGDQMSRAKAALMTSVNSVEFYKEAEAIFSARPFSNMNHSFGRTSGIKIPYLFDKLPEDRVENYVNWEVQRVQRFAYDCLMDES